MLTTKSYLFDEKLSLKSSFLFLNFGLNLFPLFLPDLLHPVFSILDTSINDFPLLFSLFWLSTTFFVLVFLLGIKYFFEYLLRLHCHKRSLEFGYLFWLNKGSDLPSRRLSLYSDWKLDGFVIHDISSCSYSLFLKRLLELMRFRINYIWKLIWMFN